jgi:hypothetical protein
MYDEDHEGILALLSEFGYDDDEPKQLEDYVYDGEE